MRDEIIKQLKESAEVKLRTAEALADHIAKAAEMIMDTYRKGGKVLLIGNGGSAADAQHIAGELVANLEPRRGTRRALYAVALATNFSVVTAIGNDHSYEKVFAREIEAAANPGDLLVALTTSGTSPNIIHAIEVAKARGMLVVGFLGKGGGKAKDMVDLALIVPSDNTQRVQETHIVMGHIVCDLVERALLDGTLV
mgnify:CR=1 FL=1